MQALLTLHEVCSSWMRFSQRNQPKKVPSTYAAEHQGEGAERSRADVLQHYKAVLVLKEQHREPFTCGDTAAAGNQREDLGTPTAGLTCTSLHA